MGACCKKFIRCGDCSIEERGDECSNKQPAKRFRMEYMKKYGLSCTVFQAKFPGFDEEAFPYVHDNCYRQIMDGEKEDHRKKNRSGVEAMLANRKKRKRGAKQRNGKNKKNKNDRKEQQEDKVVETEVAENKKSTTPPIFFLFLIPGDSLLFAVRCGGLCCRPLYDHFFSLHDNVF